MDYDLIVIGGGVSGLTLAARGGRAGWNTLLLEKDPVPGGCLASQRFQGEAAGFWTELAAHTCYNSYGALLELLDASTLARLRPRVRQSWRVLDQGRLQSVFARMHWPSLLPVLPRLFFTAKAGLGLRDYYSRVLGRRTYDRLLRHAFSAVSVQPADDFPADLLFRKKPRRKDIPRSFSFEGGLSTVAEGLAAGLPLRTDAAVTGLAREGLGYRVATAAGEFSCRRLGLAVPAWEASRLLQGVAPELAGRLAGIAPAAVESLTVAVPAAAVQLPGVAGLIGVDDDFYSMVSRDVFPDPRWRGFSFHFRPGRLDRAGKLARIAQVLGVTEAEIAATAERVSQLPALKAGHAGRLAEIDRLLAGQPLALTGNYFLGVAIGDCAERSAAEFARLQQLNNRA
jgi:protoporphyrinogen oxidase